MNVFISRLCDIGPTLKILHLKGSSFSDYILCKLVRHLPNIESLAICKTHIMSEGLHNIMLYCVRLEHLNLNGCRYITDAIIQDIFQTESARSGFGCKYTLKEIDLDLLQIRVTSIGIVCLLIYFPNLTRVDHYRLYEAVFNIYTDNMKNNVLPLKIHNLMELQIIKRCVSDSNYLKTYSIVCPHLVKLCTYLSLKQTDIDALTGFTSLKEVSIEHRGSENINFSPFFEHNGKKLEIISVRNNSASFTSLTISSKSLIQSCPNLRVLKLMYLMLEPIREKDLSRHKLNRLRETNLTLDFHHHTTIESVNAILSTSPNLEVLNLSSSRFLELFFDSIIDDSYLQNIVELGMCGTVLEMHVIKKALLAFPRLEKCEIQSSYQSWEIMELVNELPAYINKTLKKLDLEGSCFSDDILCEFVCHLPNIESLVICDTHVKSEGLWNIMLYCVCLKHLNLNGCNNVNDAVIQGIFQPEGAQDFGCKYTLKEIDLQIPVTSDGITCLLNYFPSLIRVDQIEVYEAVFNIYVDNIRNNASPLKIHNLTELEIDGTYISDENCFRIFSIVCPHLVKLSLFICADSEQVEIDALAGFTCLKEVNIENGASANIDLSPFLEHNGEKLEVITIDNSVSLSISLQSLMECCPNLKILDVINVSFEPIEENYLLTHKLSKLKSARFTLDFSEPYAIESVNTILSSSPNLEVLNLRSSDFLELFVNSIIDNSYFQNIHELDIGGKILKLQVVKKTLLASPNLQKCVIYSDHFLMREIEELVQALLARINKVWLGESHFPGHSELYFSHGYDK